MSKGNRIITITDITGSKTEKNAIGDQISTLLPERDDTQITDITDITDSIVSRVYSPSARAVPVEPADQGGSYARADDVSRGGIFRAPVIGDLGDQTPPLPLVDEARTLITGTGDQKGLSVIKTGDLAQNGQNQADPSSHIHKQITGKNQPDPTSHNQKTVLLPDQDQIATFTTWAAAWAFGEAHSKGHRVGFHYDERADLYTVTLAPARPPASPLPDLPQVHRQTFPTYGEAHAYGRAFVGRYRFSTWRDRITGRYAVTDPGWVEERIAEKRRREAVAT